MNDLFIADSINFIYKGTTSFLVGKLSILGYFTVRKRKTYFKDRSL